MVTTDTHNPNRATTSTTSTPPPPSARAAKKSASGGVACAACRYQRRRCADNCPLAPYFPPHYKRQFLNCHRLYGVHNIVKTLRSVPPEKREEAVVSLIYAADARHRDPVGGCFRIMETLRTQIGEAKAELNDLRRYLVRARAQAQAHTQFDFLPLGEPPLAGLVNGGTFLGDLDGPPLQVEGTLSEPIGLDQDTNLETNSESKEQEKAANSTLSSP